MARPAATDYLHSMRFHVDVAGDNTEGYLAGGSGQAYDANLGAGVAQAGFTTCSIPELSLEAVEYKEGTFLYPRKYSGNPSVSDCSFARGVTRNDTSFWLWAKSAVDASVSIEYRVDLDIYHYHRDQLLAATPSTGGGNPAADLQQVVAPSTEQPQRVYHLYECIPIRCKPAGDLDATSSEISIKEMDCSVEKMDIEDATA